MVSEETVLNYPYCKIPFTVHTDASDKQLGDFSVRITKYCLLLIILAKPQPN